MLFALLFCIFYVFILGYMGFSLLILLRFVLVVKTCATKDSTLSSSVLASDFDSLSHFSYLLMVTKFTPEEDRFMLFWICLNATFDFSK